MSRPARPVEGIQFPTDSKGQRSTTEANKKVWAASFAAVDEAAKDAVLNERNWRYGYYKHLMNHVKVSLQSPNNALASARAGLKELHQSFEFVRDGKTVKLAEAMATEKGTFETGFIKGSAKKATSYSIEYEGRKLEGQALLDQVKRWADYGTIEPSAAEAISMVVKNPEWTDLSDKYFVLLGAGSAMGPFYVLAALGANIIAIDLDRSGIWERLITTVEKSPATITFPMKKKQADCASKAELYENAGSNLITQAPEINNWLQTVYPEKPLIVGCYVYLDGEAHVRVALACDAIMQGLCDKRKNTMLAYLCTPTDCHVIPNEARKAAEANYSAMTWQNLLVMPIRMLAGGKMLKRNVVAPIKAEDNNEFSIVDGIVVAQGPNYALAKRMQHWRAVVAYDQKCSVSTNVAPSTATASVVSNRQFAWAYDGMPFFKPFEIFQQETSNGVMGALLVHDVRNSKSVAHPNQQLKNPLELFAHNSFHGGVWRCGYTVGSIGEVSVLIHFLKVGRPILLILFVLIIAAVFYF